MSSNNRKRSASPSGDRDESLNKRQKRENGDEKKDDKDEKKEREVKEDITAAALPVNEPDLVVGTVDRDLICAICFGLLTNPTGLRFPFCSSSDNLLIVFIVAFDCGHVFCEACINQLKKQKCPLDNLPITGVHPATYMTLKVSGLKMRCPNFKRGCKVEMLAGKEFQTITKHLEVPFF
jgi:hypothetical protein